MYWSHFYFHNYRLISFPIAYRSGRYLSRVFISQRMHSPKQHTQLDFFFLGLVAGMDRRVVQFVPSSGKVDQWTLWTSVDRLTGRSKFFSAVAWQSISDLIFKVGSRPPMVQSSCSTHDAKILKRLTGLLHHISDFHFPKHFFHWPPRGHTPNFRVCPIKKRNQDSWKHFRYVFPLPEKQTITNFWGYFHTSFFLILKSLQITS